MSPCVCLRSTPPIAPLHNLFLIRVGIVSAEVVGRLCVETSSLGSMNLWITALTPLAYALWCPSVALVCSSCRQDFPLSGCGSRSIFIVSIWSYQVRFNGKWFVIAALLFKKCNFNVQLLFPGLSVLVTLVPVPSGLWGWWNLFCDHIMDRCWLAYRETYICFIGMMTYSLFGQIH